MNRLEKNLQDTKEIFYGDMGIRGVYKGDELIWERKAPYFYLRFESENQNNN